ncbi:DEAD/DEAH box helicase [Aquisphaera giovannonii]|uniref:DEAD/DEAH box helicase n=1 Tax=Aquisphaera giovannonii TaxID=406548 RepID=A0A5B9VVH5_9BACT|nr:CRISPR-associated endonuclease Cas3'' [Aquisphaera giovannonii]QEH32074.1 DEAD/DEAH box helicase [Aquisphaera giovannonii]
MPSIPYAHSLPDRPSEDWHSLEDHLLGTARLAEGFASAFGAGEWGRLAGLWHDLGKYSEAFQGYLRSVSEPDATGHKSDLAGRVIHSTAGAQHAVNRGLVGRLLAFAIAGHHAGLPDAEAGESGLSMRLQEVPEPIDRAPTRLLEHPLPPPPRLCVIGDGPRRAFALAFFTRMVFSCLVDADFLDTEAFFSPRRAGLRPDGTVSCSDLLGRLGKALEEKQRLAADTPVNRRRREVLAACLEKASLGPGFFSLDVPTGGGKTLSSLAFALSHATQHGLRRVVYAIPFTSIIEQTANVFREALGDLGGQVLEHHSNLEPDDPVRQTDRSRLAAENFDSPLVVTTNVQLFESLFASRTSRCRKLHRLARNVIILDEAQTLPPQLLAPTLAALEELVANYGATVVLCTATQPAVTRHDGFPIGLDGVRPIIDDPARLHASLGRTSVTLLGATSNDDLIGRLRAERQALCIVNSRRHASDLFRRLDDPAALHLSASMCAAHRSEVVAEIRRRLLPAVNEPCRVISTQVIEAGVDVDFPACFRAAAGLDSIAQAAGRCNREGLLSAPDGSPSLGRVFVFDYDRKEYPTASLIEQAAQCFREVAPDHQLGLLAPPATKAYFRLRYWQQGGQDGRGWDRGDGGQSVMGCFAPDRKTLLHAQFRTAVSAYRLIDDAQTPILVPFGDRGRELIRELEMMPEQPEPERLRAFDRNAQRYVVGVYDRGLKALLESGVLLEYHGRYCLGNREAYHERLGLTFEALGLDPDRLVI